MIMHILFALAAFSQLALHVASAHVASLPAASCGAFASVCAKATAGVNTLVGVIQVLGGALVILMVALAGILFLVSRNNPKHQDGAKSALIWAVVGVAVLALADPIATGIKGVFGL